MKHHLILSLSIAALLTNVNAEPDAPAPRSAVILKKDPAIAILTIEDKGTVSSKVVDLEKKIAATAEKPDVLELKPAEDVKPGSWLGVAVDTLSEEVAAQLPLEKGSGLLVRHVVPDSPAAQAGLQDNDVLTLLDNQILVNGDQFRKLITMKTVGDSVRLTYLRKGKQAELTAKLIPKVAIDPDVKPFPIIDIEGGMKVVGDILKLVSPDKVPLTIRKQITVDPNGKITAIDPTNGSETVIDAADTIKKVLKDAGLTDEAMSKIQDAIKGALEGSKSGNSSH